MAALAIALIITACFIFLGFKGRIAFAIWGRGLHFLEPREDWSRSALRLFKFGLGIPLFLVAFAATVLQAVPTEIYLVTISANEGTKVTVPVESRDLPGLQPIVRPASVAELTEQWPDLSEEERKQLIAEIFPELPDDTQVTYKPPGSETLIETLLGDLTSDEQKEVTETLTAPDVELDLKVYLPGQMTPSGQGF